MPCTNHVIIHTSNTANDSGGDGCNIQRRWNYDTVISHGCSEACERDPVIQSCEASENAGEESCPLRLTSYHLVDDKRRLSHAIDWQLRRRLILNFQVVQRSQKYDLLIILP